MENNDLCFAYQSSLDRQTACGKLVVQVASKPNQIEATHVTCIPTKATCPDCLESKSIPWTLPIALDDGTLARGFA